MTGNARLVFAAGLASAIGGAVGSDATLWARVRGWRPAHEHELTQGSSSEAAPLAGDRSAPAAPAVDVGALRADIRAIVRDEVAAVVRNASVECPTKTEARPPAPAAAPPLLDPLVPATSELHVKTDMRGRPF